MVYSSFLRVNFPSLTWSGIHESSQLHVKGLWLRSRRVTFGTIRSCVALEKVLIEHPDIYKTFTPAKKLEREFSKDVARELDPETSKTTIEGSSNCGMNALVVHIVTFVVLRVWRELMPVNISVLVKLEGNKRSLG